jgi:hypothetical protein
MNYSISPALAENAALQTSIVQDLSLNEFCKDRINASVNELKEERALVDHLIPS